MPYPFKSCLLSICLLAVFGIPTAVAETLFIIDRIEAGLHADNTTTSPILKLLPTGTPVKVLSRTGRRIEVRTPDGTSGWLDDRYLMAGKPTRQLLNEAEAELEHAQAELERLRAAAVGEAEPAQLSPDQGLDAVLASASDLTTTLRVWLTWLAETPYYLLGVVALLLLIGMLWGAWLVDYQNRRRHGGFRL